ncbi:restriction endonuclease subunit S [Limosilactobacillus reuteri]|uniref:restriction endonuclease subunit S n=2 Tax=Limosilactobacillus reuteri TaxID=1598 RepID=UPI0005A913FC|nr:restriction endonuclease subunit S [Limosilactobacillus reuteri]
MFFSVLSIIFIKVRINVKWEQHKLRKVACINPKTNIPDNFKYVDLESVVGTSLIKAKLTTKQLAPSRAQRVAKKGDIFYQTVRPYQKNNFLFDINNYDFQYVFSTGYAQLRSEINNYFLFSYLQRQRFVNLILRRSTGTSYPAISSKDLSEIKIIFPRNSKEQENIGKIINLIDALITLQQRKLEQLKQLKKAMLQQLFVSKNSKQPVLRFKNFDSDWRQHSLKDISAKTYSGLTGKSKDDFGHGKARYITYLNVHNNEVAISDGVEQIEVDSKQNKVLKGDLLFTISSEVPSEVALNSVWSSEAGTDIYLNSFCFGIRPKSNYVNSFFLTYYLRSPQMRKLIYPLAQGISRFNISKRSILALKINTPVLPEQISICKVLMHIDNLITYQQNKLTQLTTLKRYLLQKLFI